MKRYFFVFCAIEFVWYILLYGHRFGDGTGVAGILSCIFFGIGLTYFVCALNAFNERRYSAGCLILYSAIVFFSLLLYVLEHPVNTTLPELICLHVNEHLVGPLVFSIVWVVWYLVNAHRDAVETTRQLELAK